MRASNDSFGMSPGCIIWLNDLQRCGARVSAKVKVKYSLQYTSGPGALCRGSKRIGLWTPVSVIGVFVVAGQGSVRFGWGQE